jgi:hypothetical protein
VPQVPGGGDGGLPRGEEEEAVVKGWKKCLGMSLKS